MFQARVKLRFLCPLLGTLPIIVMLMMRSEPEAVSGPPEKASLEVGFRDTVQPFLKTNCITCHSGEKPKGDLDLGAFTTTDAVARDLRHWMTVLEQLEAETMPPPKAKQQPSAEVRREVVAWIREMRKQEAKRNAGDPGPVPARRLSNAEYDHTIRDLTGVDIRPAQTFPVDPANEAGFDNSAESLRLTPDLLNKYLEAARRVSEYLVLETNGLTFAPFPAVADTDRDKFCVRQIIDFYKKQRTDYADYFLAAWHYQHRAALGQPNASLADIAAKEGVSAKFLATIWTLLNGPKEEVGRIANPSHEVGPIAALRVLWRELPPPTAKPETVRASCEKMREFVVDLRRKLVPEVKNLTAPGMNNGSQPLVLWKNRQMAANRMRYAGGAVELKTDDIVGRIANPSHDAVARALTPPKDPAALKGYEAAFASFCSTFPDAFYISERARVYLDPAEEKKLGGRLLSAGFHSMTGYFRDDGPLYELILDKDGQRELDRLWLDFDVITGAPMRQHTSFIWFEHAESGFMRGSEFELVRAEDKDCTSEAKMKELAKIYLAKARSKGASDVALAAIKDHFEIASANIRRVEKAKLEAEPKHLEALQNLAERAYRRPLSKAERDDLVAFYRTLRDKDGLSHEDAIRDTLVSVLVSPHFLYRVEPSTPGKGVQPLSDYALANRLSYFLWASMPDAELLAHAKAGDLHRPEVLAAQTKRMMKDDRIRGLATEFAGNWLDFRRFEEHNAVDRQRFKDFTDELRQAMFEEPIRFTIDVARSDRSVLDFLYAKHTFVNPVLAKHYGIPIPGRSRLPSGTGNSSGPARQAGPTSGPDDWVRIDDADKYGRGGLLPMGVFLTKNVPGLRTSPVKRGYWVVRKVLGEKIPAPPPRVPELPADEAKLDLPLREVLARHRADKSCAGCHARFDSIGLAFEGFGPIGERRTQDLAGRQVDDHAAFPGGGEGAGLEGLRTYLRERRQEEFVENFCRKLLAYALGRTLIPSDDELVEEMRKQLAAKEYKFNVLVEIIVSSPQFLKRRGEG